MNSRIYQERTGYVELKTKRVFGRFNRAKILIENTGNMGYNKRDVERIVRIADQGEEKM